jgi:hypothetical protein
LRRGEIVVAFKELAIRVRPEIEWILKFAVVGLAANGEQANAKQEKGGAS